MGCNHRRLFFGGRFTPPPGGSNYPELFACVDKSSTNTYTQFGKKVGFIEDSFAGFHQPVDNLHHFEPGDRLQVGPPAVKVGLTDEQGRDVVAKRQRLGNVVVPILRGDREGFRHRCSLARVGVGSR